MLAIARGLMSRPKLLLVDEMSLGLMPILVDKVMEIFKGNLKKRHNDANSRTKSSGGSGDGR